MSYPLQQTAQISRSAFSGVFILIFLLLALTISISGYVYYLSIQKVVKASACRQLGAVADLKAGQIERWRRQLRHDAEVIRCNPFLIEGVGDRSNRILLGYFQTIQQQYRYRSIALLEPGGALVLAVEGDPEVQYATVGELVRQAANSGEVLLSDFHRIKSANSSTQDFIQLDLVAPLKPVVGADGRPKRVIQIGIDPQVFIYPLIQTWPGVSNSAETLLIRRQGDAVIFLNELRHRKGTALNLRFPMSRTTLPAVMAAAGVQGVVEGVDYRGIAVFATVRKIPESPWFMVSKVDAREVYAPIIEKGRLVTRVSVLLIIVAGVAVQGFWWRHKAEFARRQLAAESERDALASKYDYLSRKLCGVF